MYQLGWGGDNGDPDNFTGYFFGGLPNADAVQEPVAREGWWKNQDLAVLLFNALVTPDQAAREEMYKQAEQMMHDEVLRIWLGHNNTPLLFSANVSGYIPQPVGADYYEFVELAK